MKEAKIVPPERGLFKLVPIPGKGRGLVATRRISRGTLIEAAPVIPFRKKDRPAARSVLSSYPFEWPDPPYIECFVLGYAALLNHSEKPNCRAESDVEDQVMRVYAAKTIEAGTELTWNYGVEPWFEMAD